MTEKFCTKCGSKFVAIGREVICPACKAQAAEESKRAAVLRAKRASWTGESVPVRISGRASTMIREWAKPHNMSFAESLDDLLQRVADDMEVAEMWATRSWAVWEDITPYKSRRMKKSTEQTTQDVQEAPQGKQEAPQDKEEAWIKQIKQAVIASKTSSKAAKASKPAKQATGKGEQGTKKK